MAGPRYYSIGTSVGGGRPPLWTGPTNGLAIATGVITAAVDTGVALGQTGATLYIWVDAGGSNARLLFSFHANAVDVPASTDMVQYRGAQVDPQAFTFTIDGTRRYFRVFANGNLQMQWQVGTD